jgi:hypothetical protein
MTFCLGAAEAKLANNMVNQLAWDPNLQSSERRRMPPCRKCEPESFFPIRSETV